MSLKDYITRKRELESNLPSKPEFDPNYILLSLLKHNPINSLQAIDYICSNCGTSWLGESNHTCCPKCKEPLK